MRSQFRSISEWNLAYPFKNEKPKKNCQIRALFAPPATSQLASQSLHLAATAADVIQSKSQPKSHNFISFKNNARNAYSPKFSPFCFDKRTLHYHFVSKEGTLPPLRTKILLRKSYEFERYPPPPL